MRSPHTRRRFKRSATAATSRLIPSASPDWKTLTVEHRQFGNDAISAVAGRSARYTHDAQPRAIDPGTSVAFAIPVGTTPDRAGREIPDKWSERDATVGPGNRLRSCS